MRLPVTPIAPFLCYAMVLSTGLMVLGCSPSPPAYLRQTNDLSYYIDRATDVSYPDVQTASLDEATQTMRPISVLNPEEVTYRAMTLEDAVNFALKNTKTIRGYGTPGLQGTTVTPGIDSLTDNPAGAATLYDVAVVESEPGFFNVPGNPTQPGVINSNTALETQQGVEAALAEFDAQYAGIVQYDQTDRPRNTIPVRANVAFDRVRFQQDSLNITHQLSKKSAVGTQLFFRSTTDYLNNNIPPDVQPLASVWTQAFEAEIRQPLMRGRGTMVNRTPVIMARIRSDQQLASLETQLQNLLCNVEIRYWNLQCAYRIFEANQQAMMVATNELRLLERTRDLKFVKTIYQRALEQYHFYKMQTERSFGELVDAENDLRWLLGWGSTDGALIRPEDEPLLAYVNVDWQSSLSDALVRRPELRLSRWEIKAREVALAYARNSLLPQVNATGLYRWLGSGDYLWGTNRNGVPFPNAGSRALEELTGGDYQEVSLGLEINTSIGFRQELANVRNAQLKLARELNRLEELELNTSRDLSMVVRAMDTNYQLAQANLERFSAANTEVELYLQLEEEGAFDDNNRDRFVDAVRRRTDAQTGYHQAICEYNKALALLHRRQGTTMDYAGVQFGEGAWPEKAYFDASENARRRSASTELNYGWTRPGVISQNTLGDSAPTAMPMEMMPEMMYEEILPSRMTPTPAAPLESLPMDSSPAEELPPVPSENTEAVLFEGPRANTTSAVTQRRPANRTVENGATSRMVNPTVGGEAPAKSTAAPSRVDQAVRPASFAAPAEANPQPAAGFQRRVATGTRASVTDQATSAPRQSSSSKSASLDSMFKQMGMNQAGESADTKAVIKRTSGN